MPSRTRSSHVPGLGSKPHPLICGDSPEGTPAFRGRRSRSRSPVMPLLSPAPDDDIVGLYAHEVLDLAMRSCGSPGDASGRGHQLEPSGPRPIERALSARILPALPARPVHGADGPSVFEPRAPVKPLGAVTVPVNILSMLRCRMPRPDHDAEACASDCWLCHSPYSPPRSVGALNPAFIAQVEHHGTGMYHGALVAAQFLSSYSATKELGSY